MALTSQLTFVGNTSFVNNQGSLGGALALHDSVMYLCNNTELVIKNNKALWQGGGIYVAQQMVGVLHEALVSLLTVVFRKQVDNFTTPKKTTFFCNLCSCYVWLVIRSPNSIYQSYIGLPRYSQS